MCEFAHSQVTHKLGGKKKPRPLALVHFGTIDAIAVMPLREVLLTTGVIIMGGKADEVKGRIKEAAGALTGNDKLREEGKLDQAVGEVKQVAEKAVDKVKQAVKKLRD
jgi:uncharacterized protein YjbJ (UPF0337 family)